MFEDYDDVKRESTSGIRRLGYASRAIDRSYFGRSAGGRKRDSKQEIARHKARRAARQASPR